MGLTFYIYPSIKDVDKNFESNFRGIPNFGPQNMMPPKMSTPKHFQNNSPYVSVTLYIIYVQF